MGYKGYRVGSIVTVKAHKGTTYLHTISIITKIIGDELYCKHSICSVNGEEFVHTRQVYPKYEGELASEGVTLCDTKEFDTIIDTKLIPREVLVDVS